MGNLSRNKALAEDITDDNTLFNAIQESPKVAEQFCEIWDPEVMNTKEMKHFLTGRLIPLNKVHPATPTRLQIRPIVALSPLVKLLEARFAQSLHKYMDTNMIESQTGFVRNMGTHVNLTRLLDKCCEAKKVKRPMAILFIDLKSAYNNVRLEKLFQILRQKEILRNTEVDFLQALYAHTAITIGKHKVFIRKGVMQGSTISPSLFNIYLETLLIRLAELMPIEDILAYADDIAICVYELKVLENVIKYIKEWCCEYGIPLNEAKSGVLNIKHRSNARVLCTNSVICGIPKVNKYKYLGVWIDEYINPTTHLNMQEKKIDFLIFKLSMIPKAAISPRFLINLWTLLIRPNFDYALCMLGFNPKYKGDKIVKASIGSLKKLLRLRITFPTKLIMGLMGYNPFEFARELTQNSRNKWQSRLTRQEMAPLKSNVSRIQASPILISWDLLRLYNRMFGKCPLDKEPLTRMHLELNHDIKVPDIDVLMQKGFLIEKKLKYTKRKGRIYKFIEYFFNLAKMRFNSFNLFVKA